MEPASPYIHKDPSRIRQMFGLIARRYDLNNHLHSLWMDQLWRRAAVKSAGVTGDSHVLDVACGTGDLTGMLARQRPKRLVGLDFCNEMLDVGRRKFASRKIEWIQGDALNLPLADATFDIATVAFGLRNMPDQLAALRQMHRILRPGGRLVVLEFTPIRRGAMLGLLEFYLSRVMPRTAGWISGDRTGAYKYLFESSAKYLTASQQAEQIAAAGFAVGSTRRLSLGIAALHVAARCPSG